jgi:MoaA/NifB/PqqE/SkfB family radical SAM enzyme
VAGCTEAIKAGLPVTIACVILNTNIDDIENIILMARSLGARAVKVQTLIDRGLGELNSAQIEPSLEQVINNCLLCSSLALCLIATLDTLVRLRIECPTHPETSSTDRV